MDYFPYNSWPSELIYKILVYLNFCLLLASFYSQTLLKDLFYYKSPTNSHFLIIFYWIFLLGFIHGHFFAIFDSNKHYLLIFFKINLQFYNTAWESFSLTLMLRALAPRLNLKIFLTIFAHLMETSLEF